MASGTQILLLSMSLVAAVAAPNTVNTTATVADVRHGHLSRSLSRSAPAAWLSIAISAE